MPIIVTLLAVMLVLGSGAAASPVGTSSPRGPAPEAREAARRTIALSPPETEKLDPELAAVLPGLVAAALESGGGYQVSGGREGAGWSLDLSLSGRGPWKLSARAVPIAGWIDDSRIATKKVTFTGRDDLTRAVDDLAAQLDAQWRKSDPRAGTGGSPVVLARALSTSTTASDAYIKALAALQSTDASGAAALLDRALAADPSFPLAAAERIRLHLASLEIEEARAAFARVRPRPATLSSPLAIELSGPLSLVLGRPDGRALEKADGTIARAPHLLWGRTLRALALGDLGRRAEALEEWTSIVKARPGDAAARVFLGISLMATGDFTAAAGELARARKAWPSNLILYTLQAECLARVRDTAGARQAVTEMKDYSSQHDLIARSDALNPYLLIGSVDLLEGKFAAALKRFEEAAGMKSKTGNPIGPVDVLLQTIVEMRRDLVSSRDRLTRSRQLADAETALDRYEASLSPELRVSRGMEIQRLRGLIMIKEDDTVGVWRLVEQMRAGAGQPGYSVYDEAYLSAAASMKEDDVEGALGHFERAAKARGMQVDFMDLGQTQLALRKYEEARASLKRIEEDLERWAPAPPEAGAGSWQGSLILADPHLAAMVPIYQYVRARLAFETGNGAESRRYFNRMLKYLQKPDEQFTAMVKEAIARGAQPE